MRGFAADCLAFETARFPSNSPDVYLEISLKSRLGLTVRKFPFTTHVAVDANEEVENYQLVGASVVAWRLPYVSARIGLSLRTAEQFVGRSIFFFSKKSLLLRELYLSGSLYAFSECTLISARDCHSLLRKL